MKKNIKQIFLISFLIPLLYSCWSYRDSSGMTQYVSAIDVASGIAIAIKDPYPKEGSLPSYKGNQLSVIKAPNSGSKNSTSEELSKQFMFRYITTYKGWWVYGEGQHIFKDEATLEEWNLKFLNENMEELVALYLSVCEMEYFPMECNMIGHLQNDTLEVTDFEITYIQGCGE